MRRNAARLRIVSDANRINPIEGLLIDGWVRHYGDARHAATLLQKAPDTRITIREESAGNGTSSIANFKPQPAWKGIRQWLESMQLIVAE